MTAKGLQLGDVIHCTHCGQEHTVTGVTSSNVESVKAMLYVVCRKPKPGKYYVGSIGGTSNRGPIVRRS